MCNNVTLANFSSFIYTHNVKFMLEGVFFENSIITFFFFFCYVLGMSGLLFNLKNILVSLVFVEVVYFSMVCFFLTLSLLPGMQIGFLYSFLLLLTAASESAVGLSILVLFYKAEKYIGFEKLRELGF